MACVTTGLDKLRAYGRAYWEYSKRNLPSLALLIYLDYHRFDIETHRPEVLDRYRAVVDPVVDSMREVMELARTEGDVRPDIDVDAALAHYAYSLRAVMYRALNPGTSFFEIQPDDFVHAYIEHFLRGLAPDSAPRS